MHQPGIRLGDLPAGPDPDLYDKLAAETGPDRRREQAFDAAWRFLAHRDRTEAEVSARLGRNDVEPELIDEVLDVLIEGRYVDDAALARRFAEDRRNLDGWGSERIASVTRFWNWSAGNSSGVISSDSKRKRCELRSVRTTVLDCRSAGRAESACPTRASIALEATASSVSSRP